jgi:hypothetical protein
VFSSDLAFLVRGALSKPRTKLVSNHFPSDKPEHRDSLFASHYIVKGIGQQCVLKRIKVCKRISNEGAQFVQNP